MDEHGRGDREERNAPIESEIAQQQVKLSGEERAEHADEDEDPRAACERVRDDGEDR